eukprot:5697353-Amphidinium_carterae.1
MKVMPQLAKAKNGELKVYSPGLGDFDLSVWMDWDVWGVMCMGDTFPFWLDQYPAFHFLQSDL